MNKRDLRKSLRETLDGALGRIDSGVAGIASETASFLRRIAPFEVTAAIGLDEVKTSLATAKGAGISFAKTQGIGTDDWRAIARERVPGKDVKTLYRWQNAGAVARVLGDESLAGASIGGLCPLYRILTAAQTKASTAEDLAAAQDLVRTAWAEALADAGTDEDGTQVPPTAEDVKVIAERLSPTNRSGGSETTVADATEDEDEGDEDGDEDEGAEGRRESSDGLVVVDAAAVESAAQNFAPVLRQLTEAHGVSADVVSAIGLAVLRFAGEHGTGTMVAVLAGKGVDVAPETAPETAPEDGAK